MKKLLSLAIITALIVTCFASCSSGHIQDNKDNTSNSRPTPKEITIGYDEPADAASKPLPTQRVALKCLSSYERNEKVIVDAAMGDNYSYFQEFGGTPSYDTFGENGYPVFEVYLSLDDSTWEPVDNDVLLINGKTGAYEERFSKEDMQSLDISDYYDISKYYHENVELNFSNFNVGDSGSVIFSFGWFYYHDNPDNISQSDNSWAGMRRGIGFYIGENGITFSFAGKETAEDEYHANYGTERNTIAQSEPTLCSAKPLYLRCIDDTNVQYNHSSVVERQFEINSSFKTTSFDVRITSPEDINLVSESHFQVNLLDTNVFSVKFRLTDTSDMGNVLISISPINGSDNSSEEEYAFRQEIYYCREGDYDYITINGLESLSPYSSRLADAIAEENRKGEQISVTDSQDNAHAETDGSQNIGQSELPDAETQATETTYTVNGYIRWKDSAGNIHPADGVNVYIYHQNSSSSYTYLGLVSTNSNGYYSKDCSYNGTSKNILIKVYSSGLGISVKDPSLNSSYIYTSDTRTGITGGQTVTISYTASNSTFLGQSIGVHQAMALASRYIYSLDGAYLTTVTVSFPDQSEGTSCYIADETKIYVIRQDAFDWDVLEHEYGHHVQYCYNIINSPGGDHSSALNMADELQDKSEGIRLAWGEGWATYFAINLQKKMSASSLNIPNVGDTRYQETVDSTLDYDIETLESKRTLGEANEATVAAILYDITDGRNTSNTENDYIYCSNKDIWNMTKSNHPTTLSEFVTAFYNSTFTTQAKLSLGSTLSQYIVAAKLNASPTGLSTGTPTFSWVKQGGSTLYPNNRFRLAFYNSSYELILRTSYLNATSQTLTSSQWTQIINSGSTIYCCVETFQTSAPQTGWYYSNLITLDLSATGSGTYKITNVGTGKCLNVYGDNVTSLRNHQNVCLWSDSGTNEQKWYITTIGEGAYIKSVINQSFGLNVYRSGSQWNCDLFPISGNETDSQVDFIPTNGGYKIKLHNYDLYLSASSSSNGANVYWSAESSSLYQVWSLTPV